MQRAPSSIAFGKISFSCSLILKCPISSNAQQIVSTEIDTLYSSKETAPRGWQKKEQMKKGLRVQVKRLLHNQSYDQIKDAVEKVEKYAIRHHVNEA